MAMRRCAMRIVALVCLGSLLAAGFPPAYAAGMVPLTVMVSGIRPGGKIPGIFTACIPAESGHMTRGPNKNPAISWSKGPAGTASYALITYDTDVPESFANAYKEGPILTAAD